MPSTLKQTHAASKAQPEPAIASSLPSWRSAEFGTLLLILLAYVLWMLSLPCFPSTDGPMHMYYVHIFGALLRHNNAQYAHFFRIRHLFPPYALYYYALLGLSHFVPFFLADRLIICVYFISFVFGFRYLARAIGPSADLMTLLATLLLINWPLGMGFVNFCLSLSFSLWATGLWLRILGTATVRGRVGFLFLVTVIMFTHPVPLLLLLSTTGSVLLVRLLHARRASAGGRLPEHWQADLLTWLLAALNMVYVKLFTVANPLKQVEGPSYWAGIVGRIHDYGRERALAALNGAGWDLYGYRFALALILFVPLLMAAKQRLRNRRAGVWTVSDTLLLLGEVLLIGLPLLPPQLNGLYYFADRLMVCIWIAFLLAGSGWSFRSGDDVFSPMQGSEGQHQPSPTGRLPVSTKTAALFCIVFSLTANFAFLHGLESLIRTPARIVAQLGTQTAGPRGALAFVMEDGRDSTSQSRHNLGWDPFYWAGVHVLRTGDDVMMNAPWMDESIIPVTDTDALPQVSIPILQAPYPNRLQKALLHAPEQMSATLRQAQFFIVNQVGRDPLASADPLVQHAHTLGETWHCVTIGEETFRICTKATKAP